MSYNKSLTVAIHHCPPSHMVVIPNGRPQPVEFGGSLRIEAKFETLKEDAEWSGWSEWGGSQMTEAPQQKRKYTKKEWDAWNEGTWKSIGWWNQWTWLGKQAEEEAPMPSMFEDWYHGTSTNSVISILAEGFKPSIGAGCDAMREHFNVPVPGVYLARTFPTASQYPMNETTGRVSLPGQRKESRGVPGGTLVALDGTPPLRAVFRCVIKESSHLWKRKA